MSKNPERPTFTTTLDKSIADDFRKACKANDMKMSAVLEVLMDAYAKKHITIESKTVHVIKQNI